jgi:hypothetical protein
MINPLNSNYNSRSINKTNIHSEKSEIIRKDKKRDSNNNITYYNSNPNDNIILNTVTDVVNKFSLNVESPTNNTIEYSENTKKSINNHSSSNGINFEGYSSRDISLKRFEKNPPVNSYIDINKDKKINGGFEISKFIPRERDANIFKQTPSIGIYNPKLNFVKNNFRDYSSEFPKININKNKLRKVICNQEQTMEFQSVKF